MVLEIAEINVLPSNGEQFEAAVAAAIPLFKGAQGCVSMALRKCIEEAGRYQLHVQWKTLDDHTVHFRSSEAFQQWRKLAGPFFAEPPVVTHWELPVSGF